MSKQKETKENQRQETPGSSGLYGPETNTLGEEGSPRFYANRIGLVITKLDFALSFQEILGHDEQKRLTSRELAKVYISALHAKAFRDLLDRQIASYEKQFGDLPAEKAPRPSPGDPTETEPAS